MKTMQELKEITTLTDISKEKLIELLSQIDNNDSIKITITKISKDITKKNGEWRMLGVVGNDLLIECRTKY